jgi:DNA sulfur modification protein DndD
MATIINSVAFENFYNYYGSYEHNEYKFKPGINIVNADNNMGKSKFYNGFMWLLRDQVYDSDIKAFADANESLFKMASGKAKVEDNEFKVGFKVVFTNGGIKYTMEKYALFFNRNGELIHEESRLDVMETVNNGDTPILDKDEQMDIINKVFIPLALRNYALLQGESMDRLVDLSSKKALADTIDTLAEISVLKGICDISKKMAQKAYALFQVQDSENSKFDTERKRDKEKRNSLVANIERTLIEIENAKDELNAAKRKKEQLDAYISNSSKRIEIRSQLDNIRIKIDNQKAAIEKIETSITKKIFDEENPWLLMGLEEELDTFDARREKHIGDLAQMNNDGALVIMLPEGSPDSSSLERMLKNEVCEVCGQPAVKHSPAWEHIKLILDRPKKVSTNRNDFGHFYGTLQKSASSYSRSIPQVESRIERLKDLLDAEKENLEALEAKKEDVFIELNNAGGNADNSAFNDKAIIHDYDVVNSTISSKEQEIINKQRMVATWKNSLDAVNQKLAFYKKDMSVQKYEDFADLMKKINDIIVQTKDDIYDRTIKALAEQANEKYTALTSGNQSSGGQLRFERNHDVVNVSIRDVQNGEITGLGTGFQRMKQLAIVMAIISSKIGDEKKFDYPFISDAPFSEFGENFVNNFFRVAPGVFGQSIIMIKELYDPNAKDLLTPFGRRILEDMKGGKIPGTFYVNVIEERADTTGLVTSHKCYFE